MFSQVCVKNSVHVGHVWLGVCIIGCVHGKGCAWQGGVCGRGACMAEGMCGRRHAWQGACMTGGMHGRGMHGRGGLVLQGSMHGRRDGYCRGQYTSYWNALLYSLCSRMCPSTA